MAVKYCPKCGYANSDERGACLMCYTPLPSVAAEEGQQPSPIADAPRSLEAMALVVVEAAQGSLAGMAGTEDSAEIPEEYEMAGLEEVSATRPAEEAAEEAAAVAEEAAVAAEEAEEEYIPPPPPPGAIELEEEPTETVAAAAEQETPSPPPAPPPPEGVFDVDEAAIEEEAQESAGDEWTIRED